eukprot:m.17747 g.17747  ORF g.17747 m.17747 type:complete len:281 (+) comp11658_c0_seq1:236-1078(+)
MGCGISKSDHAQAIAELTQAKDADISRLQAKLSAVQLKAKTKEEEAQQLDLQLTQTQQSNEEFSKHTTEQAEYLAEIQLELDTYRNQLTDTTSELEGMHTAHQEEVVRMVASQAELQKMLDVSAKAISSLNQQMVEEVTAKEEIVQELVQEQVKTRQQIEDLRKEELARKEATAAVDVQAAISEEQNPEAMKHAITGVQDTVTEMKVLREQIDRAQRKVAEYWQKIQSHEQLILNQKKQILTVENKNEKLLMQDPNMRLLKRRNQTSKSPTKLHKRGMVV